MGGVDSIATVASAPLIGHHGYDGDGPQGWRCRDCLVHRLFYVRSIFVDIFNLGPRLSKEDLQLSFLGTIYDT